MHKVEQISREIIDVANNSRAARVALVMIGADLVPPKETVDWSAQIAAEVVRLSLSVEAETAYSSFALIGESLPPTGSSSSVASVPVAVPPAARL